MERKLVKQGRNALTVTLPAAWLRKKGLKAGNSVDVEETKRGLLVRSSSLATKKETLIDVRDLERSMVWHLVNAKYIDGYDRIEVLHNNPAWIQEISQSFIGFVVEEHSSTRTVLTSIVVVPEENFEAVFRRTGHILAQLGRTLERLAKKERTFGDFKAEEQLLNNNINYCLRYLNKYESSERAYGYFLICATIEEAGDLLKAMAREIGGKRRFAEKVSKMVQRYVELLFKKDPKRLYKVLRAFRNSLQKKTYLDGLAYALEETLYNYLGYLVEDKQ